MSVRIRRRSWSLAWSSVLFGIASLAPRPLFANTPELCPPQELSFIARSDGTTQCFVVRFPANYEALQRRRLLIALHGHGADRWQFAVSDRAECRAVRDVAARYGLLLVTPDYRGAASWMGPEAEEDLVELIALLKRRHRADQVILAGASMGGTSALIFAALHPELIDGVVSLNGTANMIEFDGFQDYITKSYGGTKAEVPSEYRKRSPELVAKRFTMPVGLAVSGQDTVVPPDSVLRLGSRLPQTNPHVLLIYRPDTGHETDYADTHLLMEFVVKRMNASLDQ